MLPQRAPSFVLKARSEGERVSELMKFLTCDSLEEVDVKLEPLVHGPRGKHRVERSMGCGVASEQLNIPSPFSEKRRLHCRKGRRIQPFYKITSQNQ